MHYLFKSDMLTYQALEAGGAVSNLDKLQGSLNKMQFVGNCHDRKEYKWAGGDSKDSHLVSKSPPVDTLSRFTQKK